MCIRDRKDNLAPQRRALVFVDPAYQQGADLERTVKLVEHLERAWHSARVAVWYPVRDTAKVDQLHDALRALPRVKEILAAELVRDEDDGGRLPGSGVVLVLVGALGDGRLPAEPGDDRTARSSACSSFRRRRLSCTICSARLMSKV